MAGDDLRLASGAHRNPCACGLQNTGKARSLAIFVEITVTFGGTLWRSRAFDGSILGALVLLVQTNSMPVTVGRW